MSKIVFLKDINTVYDGEFTQIGTNQVRLVFTDNVPSEEVLLSGFNLINEYNGRIQTKRTDYIYIYRTYKDNTNCIELCNDNIPWVKPEVVTKFTVDAGGALQGKTEQKVDTYEELVVPTVQTEDGYEFTGWKPEIPTEGEVKDNTTFNAVIIDKNVYFHTSGGGSLDGEIKQAVNDYSELEIPTPIADENYAFVGWMPEIPASGVIDSTNANFYAVFEDNTSDRLDAIESDLTDTQMGLVENYDFTLATAEEITDVQLALVEIYDLLMGGI